MYCSPRSTVKGTRGSVFKRIDERNMAVYTGVGEGERMSALRIVDSDGHIREEVAVGRGVSRGQSYRLSDGFPALFHFRRFVEEVRGLSIAKICAGSTERFGGIIRKGCTGSRRLMANQGRACRRQTNSRRHFRRTKHWAGILIGRWQRRQRHVIDPKSPLDSRATRPEACATPPQKSLARTLCPPFVMLMLPPARIDAPGCSSFDLNITRSSSL